MKRGQVTVFIIIAVIVVAIVVGVVYFSSTGKSFGIGKTDTGPVNSFIQSCLDETLKEATEYVALQGGYYNEPVVSKFYIFHNIPYYWLEGQSQVPEISTIEQEISEYMEDNMDYCLNDFQIFENTNYKIETFDIEISSLEILDNSVEAKINLPTTISMDEKVVEYKKFDSTISSDLKKVYDLSKKIIEEQKKTPNEMPLGFISLLANDNGFTFETMNLEDDDVVYSLIFGTEGEGPFIYTFVVDYDWSEDKEGEEENETA